MNKYVFIWYFQKSHPLPTKLPKMSVCQKRLRYLLTLATLQTSQKITKSQGRHSILKIYQRQSKQLGEVTLQPLTKVNSSQLFKVNASARTKWLPDGVLNCSKQPNGDQNEPFWTPLGHHGHLGHHQVAIWSPREFGHGTCIHLRKSPTIMLSGH